MPSRARPLPIALRNRARQPFHPSDRRLGGSVDQAGYLPPEGPPLSEDKSGKKNKALCFGVWEKMRAKTAVVVGAQWGDEGKGKIVDVLSERFSVVARYAGGHNAGHTVIIRGQK